MKQVYSGKNSIPYKNSQNGSRYAKSDIQDCMRKLITSYEIEKIITKCGKSSETTTEANNPKRL